MAYEFQVDKRKIIGLATMTSLLPVWMKNMGANMKTIIDGQDIRQLPEQNSVLLVVGAGPSIKKFNHLEMLVKSDFKGKIIATDKILIPLLKAGIVPDYVCSVDGDKKILEFYDDPLVRHSAFTMRAIFSTTVHPSVIEFWKQYGSPKKMYFFLPVMDDIRRVDGLTKGLLYMTSKTGIIPTGDVGGMCVQTAVFLKCKTVAIIGMDYSEYELENLPDYQDYINRTKPKDREVSKYFHRFYHPIFKNYAWAGLVFQGYYNSFMEKAGVMSNQGYKIINCTGHGLIREKPVESMKFDNFLKTWRKYAT